MKEVSRVILDNDMVISAENVQKMGEVIALTCIKTVMFRSGKDLHYLYKGLLRDMNRSKEDIVFFLRGVSNEKQNVKLDRNYHSIVGLNKAIVKNNINIVAIRISGSLSGLLMLSLWKYPFLLVFIQSSSSAK